MDYSSSLTAVLMPEGHNADAFRATVLKHFDMSLGNGLAKLAGRVFRIGHLGDFNDLMLTATLSGVEMGLPRRRHPASVGWHKCMRCNIFRNSCRCLKQVPQQGGLHGPVIHQGDTDEQIRTNFSSLPEVALGILC